MKSTLSFRGTNKATSPAALMPCGQLLFGPAVGVLPRKRECERAWLGTATKRNCRSCAEKSKHKCRRSFPAISHIVWQPEKKVLERKKKAIAAFASRADCKAASRPYKLVAVYSEADTFVTLLLLSAFQPLLLPSMLAGKVLQHQPGFLGRSAVACRPRTAAHRGARRQRLECRAIFKFKNPLQQKSDEAGADFG